MKQKLPAIVVLLLLVTPTWLADLRARTIGPYDEAVYGRTSVELWRATARGPRAWGGAMRDALLIRPPAISWIGQLAVPVGERLGSVPAALLSTTAAVETLFLALLYLALMRIQPSRAGALLATAFVAAGPKFLVLGTMFFVEPLQALAVVWLLVVFAYRREMSRPLLAAHLVSAAAFGLLVKITTPAFQAPLAAAILVELFRPARPRPPRSPTRAAHLLAALGSAALLSAGVVIWYRANLARAVRYALGNTVGAWVAAPSGILPASYAGKLLYWLGELRRSLAGTPLLVAACLVLGAALVLRFRGGGAATRDARLAACLAVAAAALVLGVCAATRNADARYLLAFTPFAGALLFWAIVEVDRRIVSAALGAVIAFQLVSVASRIAKARENPVEKRLAQETADAVDGTLAATCKDAGTSVTMVGNSSRRFNSDLLSFSAAVRDPGHRRGYQRLSFKERCGAAWERARQDGGVEYFVARAAPTSRPRPADDACADDLLAAVAADPLMEPTPASGGVLVFRRRPVKVVARPDVKRSTAPDGALPFGYLDWPRGNTVYSSSLSVDGWIVADAGLSGLDVALESARGERWEPTTVFSRLHEARPGVGAAFPRARGSAQSGFEAEVNVSAVPEGSYWLIVTARTEDGRQRDIGRVPIEIRHGP